MDKTDRRVFDTCFELWSARSRLLDRRRRLKRYTYGDQWGDIVTRPDGKRVVESDWITSTGRRPITNNLIRRLVKTIVGRYRDMSARNGWYTAPSDDSLLLEEVDSRLLEEFLISGMAIQRVADDNPLDENGANVSNVCPEAFFSNDFRDPRGLDIEIVGMLHDMSPAEAVMRFGNGGSDAHPEALRELLSNSAADGVPVTVSSAEFFTPVRGRLRVIEVWTREFDGIGTLIWRARWFTPSGKLLAAYDSPWAHGSHPFAVKYYPLTDGEVHSFVEDVIDQQRYINRIIVLIDRILATSAKGVLLFPMHQKPENMDWKEVSERWCRPDGIIPVSGRDDLLPRQIGGTSADAGAYRLLEMELNLFDKTSGVGAALLGNANGSGANGAEYYNAQVENATIALADIFRTFRSLVEARDNKMGRLSSTSKL